MVRTILSNNVGLPLLFLLSAFCNIFTAPTMVAQPQRPQITSFSPKSARQGDTITIIGTHFIGVDEVSFGHFPFSNPANGDLTKFPAASFAIISDTLIKAVVGAGGSRNVMVFHNANNIGGDIKSGFNFVSGSFLFDYSPFLGSQGQTITITCAGASEVTNISFGGVAAASFIVTSPTTITAVIGTGATGSISVTKPIGTATSKGFVYGPTITSFSPSSARQGDTVTINGFGFSLVNSVRFGTTTPIVTPAASFTVISPTQIKAVVGTGATGSIAIQTSVFNDASFATSKSGFTFIAGSPTITNFSPKSARQGDTVTIQGTNFVSTFIVKFGGINAASFTQISSTVIKAVVGAGASGDVSVLTPGGTATQCGFSFFTAPAPSFLPTIESFSPSSAKTGDTITIQATGIPLITGVTFGGVPAASLVSVGSTIKAVVGAGASGDVALLSAIGTASRCGFTFIPAPPKPIITSFQQVVRHGDTLSIRGQHLSNTSSVVLAGLPQQQIINVSDSLIKVIVVSAVDRRSKTGQVMVTTPIGVAITNGGSISSSGAIVICTCIVVCPPFPITTSVSPTTFHKGDTLSISGTGLLSVSKIFISAISNFSVVPNLPPSLGILEVPMASFTIISDNLIKAVVGNGVSGQLSVHGDCGGGGPARLGFPNGGPIEPLMTCLTPTIHGFFPQSARKGDTVIIRGDFVGGPTSVSFGGKLASSFSFTPDILGGDAVNMFFGTIRAIVGGGASGNVQVTTDKGSDTMGGFTFLSTFTAKAPNNRDEQSLLKKSATPSEESLTVYPNPAANTVTLETLLESESTAEVVLSDILGKRLWSSRESLQGGKLSTQIDMSQYTAGIYRIDVIHANGQHRIARVLKR